jgi:hypothetical protein
VGEAAWQVDCFSRDIRMVRSGSASAFYSSEHGAFLARRGVNRLGVGVQLALLEHLASLDLQLRGSPVIR